MASAVEPSAPSAPSSPSEPSVQGIIEARKAAQRAEQLTERAIDEAHDGAKRFLADGILLGGTRWFPPATPTFEHERYRIDAVRRAGAMPLVQRYTPDTDPDALAADIIQAAFERSALFDLLATLLVAEGVTWTPKLVGPNALFFASLSDPGDLARLEGSVLWLVLDFFLSLAKSSPISLKSLRGAVKAANAADQGSPESPSDPRAISRFAADNSASAAPTTSASGM